MVPSISTGSSCLRNLKEMYMEAALCLLRLARGHSSCLVPHFQAVCNLASQIWSVTINNSNSSTNQVPLVNNTHNTLSSINFPGSQLMPGRLMDRSILLEALVTLTLRMPSTAGSLEQQRDFLASLIDTSGLAQWYSAKTSDSVTGSAAAILSRILDSPDDSATGSGETSPAQILIRQIGLDLPLPTPGSPEAQVNQPCVSTRIDLTRLIFYLLSFIRRLAEPPNYNQVRELSTDLNWSHAP
ncbi:unnamed protein product [Protopolystoma xenopodis]|uniref:Uncharacterized protein n=1 Tax=Protopolystoma xenopodis TaxID=117903 RepID=A0A448XLP8_9PLAT|nr:unnamed protein product [Protopolystoma xenopodis]